MTFRRSISFTAAALLLPLALLSAAPKPQSSQSDDSVVDAARKAREQRSKTDAKPAKVFTNEDVSSLKGTISVVGPGAEPAAKSDEKASTDKAATAAPAGPKDEAYWRKAFAAARRTLSDDARELDILQREFNLKQQQYFSDPNVALREQNSRKDLDDTQAKIDQKKADVDKDNQAIADLEDQLRQAGGDPGWASEDASAPPVPGQPPSDAQPASEGQPTTPAPDAQPVGEAPPASDAQPANP